jgi:prepilin-type N-terminal cleavage/methylation domain-containing protein
MHLHRGSKSPHRRAGRETGFTLIELLVVITILGILAGIVIFAVSGIGDKGKKNAAAEDARTLRTAEEANCAQFSQYATVDELVANKLLASGDTLNTVSLGDDKVCGTVPGRSSYSIFDPTAATQFLTGGSGVGAGIPVGSSPIDVAINPKTNRVYVTNSGSNTVSVIDGATDTILGTPIPVGTSPRFIAVNPANNKIYVSNVTGKTVSVINGATNAVSPPLSFTVGGTAMAPGAITVNPVNNDVYVMPSGSVAGFMRIDGSTDAATEMATPGGLPLSAPTSGVAINAKTNTGYLLGAGTLIAIDGSTHAMTTHSLVVPVITNQSFLTVDPAKNRIYITGTRSFTNPDGSAGAIGTTITVNGNDYSSTFVQEPTGSTTLEEQIVVDPNTNQVYSLGVGDPSNSIMHFDPSANRYVNVSASYLQASAVNAPARTHQLVVNANTHRLYIPLRNTPGDSTAPGGLIAVDGSTMQATDGSPLGGGRQFISMAINPVTNKIYAVEKSPGNDVVVLR